MKVYFVNNSKSFSAKTTDKKKYGFTPHALRHAYNIRGHKLGINQKMLADSLGHSLQMNESTYRRHESDKSKLQGSSKLFLKICINVLN